MLIIGPLWCGERRVCRSACIVALSASIGHNLSTEALPFSQWRTQMHHVGAPLTLRRSRRASFLQGVLVQRPLSVSQLGLLGDGLFCPISHPLHRTLAACELKHSDSHIIPARYPISHFHVLFSFGSLYLPRFGAQKRRKSATDAECCRSLATPEFIV